MPRTIAAVVLSAVLLIIAYPQLDWAPLAWAAFIPVLLILDGKSYKASFGWFYCLGFIFFSGTLGWFIYVTYPGAFLLIAYLSLYFALFGLAVRFFRPFSPLSRIFVLPSVWVLLEFIRSHALSGFGWVLLGHSQYKNVLIAQIADITGVYGVSFLVMMVNVLVVESFRCVDLKKVRQAQIIVIASLCAVLSYGFWTVAHPMQLSTVKVGVVQPNIPQDMKWDEKLQSWIVQETLKLTEKLKKEDPDLVVWPETSLPGVFSEAPFLVKAIKLSAVKMHTPILMGAITDQQGTYYNSAYLIGSTGAALGRYDKMHLVPFGEYIPLRPILGWINKFVALEDFTSGKVPVIFKVNDTPFGVLICFEDTVAPLWRDFANAGAGYMVNMTNDAWFMDTKAPFIHLQASVFGAIANKRALVRAANTGFSGFIDPFGRIIAGVEDARHKKTFVDGVAYADVPVVMGKTFYTKYGDVFTYGCLSVILWAISVRRRNEKNISR